MTTNDPHQDLRDACRALWDDLGRLVLEPTALAVASYIERHHRLGAAVERLGGFMDRHPGPDIVGRLRRWFA